MFGELDALSHSDISSKQHWKASSTYFVNRYDIQKRFLKTVQEPGD